MNARDAMAHRESRRNIREYCSRPCRICRRREQNTRRRRSSGSRSTVCGGRECLRTDCGIRTKSCGRRLRSSRGSSCCRQRSARRWPRRRRTEAQRTEAQERPAPVEGSQALEPNRKRFETPGNGDRITVFQPKVTWTVSSGFGTTADSEKQTGVEVSHGNVESGGRLAKSDGRG